MCSVYLNAVLVQAKIYPGASEWHSLTLTMRVAQILREANYRGYISLEMEDHEDATTAVPKSLELLRMI